MRALVIAAVAAAVALAALSACGDNTLPDGEPLHAGHALTIIAHQDDDLLFMQPDLTDELLAHTGMTNVYVTAGNDNKAYDYSESREYGLEAAYAAATGNTLDEWSCGWITIADHAAEHCRLAPADLSLVFLDYPDGGKLGQFSGSLLQLWEGTIAEATTVARRPTTYDQDGLISAVAAIVTDTNPGVIRTLDIAATHGRDHIDHMIVGALALLGAARAGSEAQIVSFRGYDVEAEQPNTPPPLVARAQLAITDYAATCGQPCTANTDPHQVWEQRRYAVGFRAPLAAAQIVSPTLGQCMALDASGQAIELADCATAPSWQLTPGGALQSGASCIQRLPTGELVAAVCDATAIAPEVQRWFFDDEGHIWSGVAPTPVADMSYQHLSCLAASAAGAKVHTDLCGLGNAPTWVIARAPARTAIALPVRGTALRIGDVDGDGHGDLVTVSDDGALTAFLGLGDGTFATTATPVGTLAITPSSLALADLDGDGSADACGRDGNGVACLIGGAPVRWSSALADAGSGGDASLAIVGGQVCGSSAGTLTCAARDGATTLVSMLPSAAAAAWAADLDGDGVPDGCALDAGGLGCNLAAERVIGQTVAPWSFSLAGVIDSSAASPVTSQLADLDGDGRADTCDLDVAGGRVACARSQAHDLGPRFTALSPLPAGADTLVLGDLDGDGHADVCVASATGVSCAISP